MPRSFRGVNAFLRRADYYNVSSPPCFAPLFLFLLPSLLGYGLKQPETITGSQTDTTAMIRDVPASNTRNKNKPHFLVNYPSHILLQQQKMDLDNIQQCLWVFVSFLMTILWHDTIPEQDASLFTQQVVTPGP